MTRALWLLLWLRTWAALRRLGKGITTLRGASVIVVTLLVMGGMLASTLFLDPATPEHLEEVRRLGAWFLLAACAGNLIISSGEGTVTFVAAEVNLLFPAPFTRRQLLVYKVVQFVLASAGGALFFAVVLRPHSALFISAFLGSLSGLLFMSLFGLALTLLAAALGQQAYNRQRLVVLVLLILIGGATLVQVGIDAWAQGWRGLLAQLDESPLVQILLTPFRWFSRAFAADVVFPDLVQWWALTLGVNLLLLLLVLALDAHYLEVSAAASERQYARLQLLRQGGVAAASGPLQGKPRWSLPGFPFWGGVGPLLWRQLSTALRCWSVLVRFVIVVAFSAGPMLGRLGEQEVNLLLLAGGLAFMTSLMAPMFVPFDFRGDLDRLELLKTLPISATRLAFGQVLAPVLLVSLCHWVFLIGLAVWQQIFSEEVILALSLILLVNFVFFSLENLLFLWYPNRLSATPGDFQMSGRMVLNFLFKILLQLLVMVPIGLAGGVVYWLTEILLLAVCVAVFVALSLAAGLLFLVGWAFTRFDVARDKPE